MYQNFTLREIAAAIAKAENRPDEERIFQQLKGATSRGLLRHKDEGGPKRAFRFPLEEIAKARMIMRAADSGMSGSSLAKFENSLRVHTRKLAANGKQTDLSLAHAVASLNEVDWIIQIVATRANTDQGDELDSAEPGEPELGISWLPNGNRFGDLNPLDSDVGIPGKVIEEVRFIPFSALVRPIFQILMNS